MLSSFFITFYGLWIKRENPKTISIYHNFLSDDYKGKIWESGIMSISAKVDKVGVDILGSYCFEWG